jgi:hypothetical protein
MKKNIHFIGYIAMFMMLFLQSCTDHIVENDGNDPIDISGMVPVVLDLSGITLPNTYSTDYGNETSVGGTAAENRIDDVRIYIFDSSNNCEKVLHGISSSVGPEYVTTGIKQILAVVNSPAVISGGLPATPAGVGNFNSFRKRLTDIISSRLSSPFLMVGEKLNYSLTTGSTIADPTHISVELERACAKVTMKISKKGKAAAHDIKIKRISLNQGANSIYLFDAPSPNPVLYDVSHSEIYAPAEPVTLSPTYLNIPDTFYTYAANVGNDKSKAAYFEIESEVNSPSNVKTARFYLAKYVPTAGDTVYDIRRNYWYDVNVDITNPGMDSLYVTVNVSRWNEAPVQPEEPGGGYDVKTSQPFKLVKSYTFSELSAGNNGAFAAIEKHTKGESYIDLKVTDGVSWGLEFKSSTGENAEARMALGADSANWASDWTTSLTGTGDDQPHRIWIYRPYVENAEPESGPTLRLTVGGVEVRDFVVQPRDTIPIPTNSYILRPQLTGTPPNETRVYIPLASVYRYWEDFIMRNGDSIPAGAVTAELLWEDFQAGGVVKNISVINAGKRDQAYIYAEAGSVPGNAVLAMKVNGTIYWSFHLWITEYNPYEAAGQKLYVLSADKGNIFMDRNLGALNNEYELTGGTKGLFYQFGRKDPFPRGLDWTAGNLMWYKSGVSLGSIIPETTLSAATQIRPLEAIPAVLNNPTKFYGISGAWPLSSENNYLWNTNAGNKTAFDPCPEGWCIPKQKDGVGDTYSPWKGLTATNFTYNLNASYLNGRYKADAGYYPLSGYMDNGVIQSPSTGAYYWTSWSGATFGTGLRITDTAVTTSPDISKSYGVSVRCIVDVNYLLNVEGGGLFGNSAGGMEENIIP